MSAFGPSKELLLLLLLLRCKRSPITWRIFLRLESSCLKRGGINCSAVGTARMRGCKT
ncbi:hypothetical protein CBM2615_U30011 [Cupriavidus taiwanensis]|uniref:Uncharacterized protein n=1 Tax=Cupriavidus taiwanensis TaxID=164546 RepID=A0A375EEY4_9BURK|nr:hypothetical protein CBM2615_U30011 [Cupriavidus taiwanensis]SOZ75334.1 hypothetical protein CBM2613_U30011 [Cupriavidus taiwanensis]